MPAAARRAGRARSLALALALALAAARACGGAEAAAAAAAGAAAAAAAAAAARAPVGRAALDADHSQLSPAEAARVLRSCLARRGALVRPWGVGKRTAWAGNVLYSGVTGRRARGGGAKGEREKPSLAGAEALARDVSAVLAGPLIPKAGSTTLRALWGDTERPRGMYPRSQAKPGRAFQFAIVRNPLEHFVAGVKQVASYPKPTNPLHVDIGTWCGNDNATSEAARARFAEAAVRGFVDANPIGTPEDWRPGQVNEHRLSQLFWLRSYVDAESGKYVPVAERLDALIRMEQLEADWEAATRQAEEHSEAAGAWMRASRERVVHSRQRRDHISEDDDRAATWAPLCRSTTQGSGAKGGGGDLGWAAKARAEKSGKGKSNAVRHVHGLLAHREMWRRMETNATRALCTVLADDFACLRYALPLFCHQHSTR